MKKLTFLLALMVIFAMVLSACTSSGKEETGELGATTSVGGEATEGVGGVAATSTETTGGGVGAVATSTSTTGGALETSTPQAGTGGTGGLAGTGTPAVGAEATQTQSASGAEATETKSAGVGVSPQLPNTGAMTASRLTTLMDLRVQDLNGDDIGDINDFIINLKSQQICYAIVGVGGFLGIGEANVAIPYQAMTTSSVASGDNGVFVLAIDKSTLEKAPKFNKDEANFTSPNWDATWFDFWSTQSMGGSTSNQGGTSGQGASATGTPAAGAAGNQGNAGNQGSLKMARCGAATSSASNQGNSGSQSSSGNQGASATGTPSAAGAGNTGAMANMRDIMLASELLGADVMARSQASASGQGNTGNQSASATGTPGASSAGNQGASETGTPSAGGTSNQGSAGSQSANQTIGMVDDAIVDAASGQICFVALTLNENALPSGSVSNQGSTVKQSGAANQAHSCGILAKGRGATSNQGNSGKQGSTGSQGASATGTPGSSTVTTVSGWVLVPPQLLQWDEANNALILNANIEVLSHVPRVDLDTLFDTGWSEVETFWESQGVTR